MKLTTVAFAAALALAPCLCAGPADDGAGLVIIAPEALADSLTAFVEFKQERDKRCQG